MALINDIITLLENAYNTDFKTLSSAAKIAEYGKYLAALGGMIYIGKSIIGQVARNESINFIPLVRPIFFLLAVAWSTSICDSIDSIAKNLSGAASSDVQQMKDNYEAFNQKLEEIIEKKWEKIRESSEAYDTEFGENAYADSNGISQSVAVGFGEMKDQFVAALLDTTTSILQWINYLAFMAMYIISFLFRICLRAIAPIAIGIAIFDGFSNNAFEWLGKYINFALLPAIANIYGAFSFKIMTNLMKQFVDAGIIGNENAANPSISVSTMGAVYIAILVIMLVGWFFIPTIANMVVSVGGTSAVAQGFAARSAALGAGAGRSAATAGKMTVMAGGAMNGGISSAVSNYQSGYSGASSMAQQKGYGSVGAGLAGTGVGAIKAVGGFFKGASQGAASANIGRKNMAQNFSYKYGNERYAAGGNPFKDQKDKDKS